MASSMVPRADRSGWFLAAVFVAIIASFFASTLVGQYTSARVDTYAQTLVNDSAPSINHLAAVRGEVLRVEALLSRFLDEDSDRTAARAAVLRSLTSAENEVEEYLHLPTFPGETDLWNRLQQSLRHFDGAAQRVVALADAGGDDQARAALAHEVEPAAEEVTSAALAAIDFNAGNSARLAREIQSARQRMLWAGYSVDALFSIFAALGAWAMWRQLRSGRALLEAYTQTVEERSAELDQFAGRVAHDIRNPLSGALTTAELIFRRSAEPGTRQLATRIIRSVARANAITTALLDFARAGARPEPGATTDVRATLADLVSGLRVEAEEAGVELVMEEVPPVFVAASTGAYLSLVSNLLRNAIKYIGTAAVRRVSVRVLDLGAVVQTEVADTGPGILPEHRPSLFDPWFRVSRSSGTPGVGLGLATVKRLAEGHGGSVGVESTPRQGSRFWFTLPKAEGGAERADVHAAEVTESRLH